ncbi:UPF0692 protein C19orf54 homolog [Acanthaster planci]|uniref:Actin maturation protease n=1 Tax=Acanthaster planci TaxID=133434 RepID=A0A8B7ZW68_ACAPL|nr:UPF0692 protein C19orf54 homolog [Acanthaster planci]
MEKSGRLHSPVSTARTCDSTGAFQPPTPDTPPPPPPPPQIPPPPCQPLPPLGGVGSSELVGGLEESVVWDDAGKSLSQAGKEEIAKGIQKLLSWGMCSEEDDTVWIASNRHTAPILQHGPECGIVALCMAVNMVEPVLADRRHIVQTAKKKGYTIQGEMFSATNLLELGSQACGVRGRVLAGNMMDNRDDIIAHLASGWPVLVPYDKDGNCEPCCLRGHKAHWAVITGFLLQCKRHDLQGLHTTQMYQDLDILNLYHISSGNSDKVNAHDIQTVHAILHHVPTSDVYVLARQGKSRHTHPWRYCTLADSNRNLTELGGNIEADIERYVIPEGGIQAGLCGQVVLLKP